MEHHEGWTAERVGQRLVEAFRLVPGRPVLSRQGGFTIDDTEVTPFGWPERYLPDVRDRRILMTWASCRASGQSIRERFAGFGWDLSTADKRRKRALAAIAIGLSRDTGHEAWS